LDKNELLTKIRLISFVSVAATKDLIPYAEVSALTGLPEDEVEMLVVEGITRGMCDARLDQKKARDCHQACRTTYLWPIRLAKNGK